MNGSTHGPSPATKTAPTPYPPGYTSTTITADTPHSAATHRSPASTTSLDNTTRRSRGSFRRSRQRPPGAKSQPSEARPLSRAGQDRVRVVDQVADVPDP